MIFRKMKRITCSSLIWSNNLLQKSILYQANQVKFHQSNSFRVIVRDLGPHKHIIVVFCDDVMQCWEQTVKGSIIVSFSGLRVRHSLFLALSAVDLLFEKSNGFENNYKNFYKFLAQSMKFESSEMLNWPTGV